MLRRVMRIKRMETIITEDIIAIAGVVNISEKIRVARLGVLDHVE